MNFLAHQYLSFNKPEIQIGNLYGEVVRGKDFLDFKGDLQKGILLHRQIDTFTDAHESVKNSTRIFHEKYGKYSPIIVDVLYDYLLIKNWDTYSQVTLNEFIENCYQLFEREFHSFPERLQFIVKNLLKYDWFHNYASLKGIEGTLKGISQRSKFPNQMGEAVQEFRLNQDKIQEDFNVFFPELISHCKLFLEI
ncbi:MAG TPA: ACP phosphodiesterase [Moheibacter sp.]|nr:ACP phosphodiesterase [Moheibacter sp.]